MTTHFHLGWLPDLPDHRDVLYSAPLAALRELPTKVDLRKHMPPVYDQGHIGSCTANAIAGAVQFGRLKHKESPDFVPSRLFVYYNERALHHQTTTDAGARLRDGIKTIAKLGVCTETTWPYADTEADPETHQWAATAKPAEKPSQAAYTEAADYKAISYQRITQSLAQLKGCLTDGFPFAFGFTVFTSLWGPDKEPRTTVPLPSDSDSPVGGHAVLAVGYDDERQVLIVRNSWGPKHQDHGYFYLPYAYVTERGLANDFWTIRAITR